MRLTDYVPMLAWLPGYTRSQLARDTVAGTTTAVMLVPQAMAYAMLAGLRPEVGLYASMVPLVLYAVFGTSRQLAVGPVAMVSLLVATSVGALVPAGTAEYAAHVVLLTLMVGVLQVIMGLARLGFLTNFLSHPVLSGFTSAAAIIIGISQLGHFLGIQVRGSHHGYQTLMALARQLSRTHGTTLLIGVASVVLLIGLRRLDRRVPGALLVVVLATLAVWAFGLAERGVRIVGPIPSGLPSPGLPWVEPAALSRLWPAAVTIALVGFMESIAVAKSFARRDHYEVHPNQELIGLGIANLGAALFRAFPVTGGFSRTAVNAQAGAQTSLASVVTALFVGLTLLFLTPLFHDLPQAVLAAIVLTAVFGLVEVREVVHLWKVKRSDLLLLLLTFLATLLLGIEQGILTGVAASLLWFVVRTTRPHFAVLGRLPGSRVFRNVDRFPHAETCPGILVVRMDAQFYFGNVSFLRETLRRLESEQTTPLWALVLDATSINQLDSSADAALSELHSEYERRGVVLCIAGAKGPVLDVMRRSGLYEKLGEKRFFFEVADAWDTLKKELSVNLAPVDEAPGRAKSAGELAGP